jgi:hypothetical protein
MENIMRKASTKFREIISPRGGSLHRSTCLVRALLDRGYGRRGVTGNLGLNGRKSHNHRSKLKRQHRRGASQNKGGCVLGRRGLQRGTRMPFGSMTRFIFSPTSTPIDARFIQKGQPCRSPHGLRRGWDAVVLEPPGPQSTSGDSRKLVQTVEPLDRPKTSPIQN